MNDLNQPNNNGLNLNPQPIPNNTEPNNNGLNTNQSSIPNYNLNNITGNTNQQTLGQALNQNHINQDIPTRSEYHNSNTQNEQPLNVIPQQPVNEGTNTGLSTQNNLLGSYSIPTDNTNQKEPNNQPPVSNVPPVSNNNNETDDTFTEPKKKPIALIIIIILLVLLASGAAVYYFIIDNPKTIFQSYADKLLDSTKILNNQGYEKYNLEYSLDFDITTSDEEYEYLYAILSDFTFNGNIGYDKSQDSASIIINSNYSDKALPSIHMLTKSSENTSYLSLKELYPKTIKVESEEDSLTDDTQKVDTSIDDYKQVYNSFLTALKESMANAKYTKSYTKLNDKLVKKITINIDKSLVETLITKLLNDEKFIASYAKIMNITEGEVSDELNEELSNLEDKTEVLSIYLGIINNEFNMLDIDAGEDGQIKITKENDTYQFEYSENYTLMYQGKITITKNSNQTSISLSIDLLEEKTSVKLNMTTKLDETKGIDELDTSNTVNIDEISEDDMTNIMEKLLDNDAITSLLKDTGLDSFLLDDGI